MALAYVIRETFSLGSKVAKFVQITGDTSYPANGYDINADKTKLGFAIIDAIIPLGVTAGGWDLRWDRANKKLMVYEYDYANAGEGPALEHDAATNLSTLVAEVIVVGA